MHRLLPSAITMLLLMLIGCGRGDRPLLAPVSGTVTYNGRPLARGRITFHPEQGRSASGKIVDGNDVVAIWRVVQESIHRARAGAGPTMIECQIGLPGSQEPLAHLEQTSSPLERGQGERGPEVCRLCGSPSP